MPKVELKETSGCLKKFHVEVEQERLDQEIKLTVSNLKRNVQLPGFRKGKAPESLIVRRFGSTIRQEALKELLPKIVQEVIESEELIPVNEPEITDLDMNEDTPVAFTLAVEEIPEIDVNAFEGLQVAKVERAVTDEDFENEIDRLRNMYAVQEEVERGAQMEDILVVNLQKLDETGVPVIGDKMEKHVIRLDGKTTPSPEFDKQVLDMKKGDSKRVRFTYDESINKPELVNITEAYEVEVLQVIENKIPELNDEFIALLGDFDDIDDFHAKTRERLERQFEMDSERMLHTELVENFIKQEPFEVPNSMVENVINSEVNRLKEMNPERSFDENAYRSQVRPDAVRAVQTFVIINAVKEKQEIEAAKEEVDERIEALAAINGLKPRELRRRLIKEGSFNELKDYIIRNKAYEWMVSVADVSVESFERQTENSRIIKP